MTRNNDDGPPSPASLFGEDGNGSTATVDSMDPANEDVGQFLLKELQRFTDNVLSGRMDALTVNEINNRTRWLRTILDPRRNVDDECGYPPEIDIDLYHHLYNRDPIAHRVMNCLPRESWKVTPSVYDSEDPSVLTKFERDWMMINRQLRGGQSWYQDEEGSLIWEYTRRADEISGIDYYGIMLLGFSDVRDGSLARPVVKADKLLFIRCFPGKLAKIESRNDDGGSSTFGMPDLYRVTFNDPSGVGKTTEKLVHHSRVIHLADNVTFDEAIGMPRAQVPFNRIHDLHYNYGGSAQMYWRGAFPGIAFELPDSAVGAKINVDEGKFKKAIEAYFNGLQRYFFLYHLKAKSLAPQVVDPTNQIMVQLQAICIYLGIPMRIFMGSERGQLASTQDEDNFNDRLRFRQRYYITPRIIVPLVDRLIQVGVVSPPEGSRGQNGKRKRNMRKPPRRGRLTIDRPDSEGGTIVEDLPGGYSIWWPDLTSQTDKDRADIALKKAQALSSYVGGNVESIMTPADFYVSIMTIDDAEAMTIVDNAMEALKNEELMIQPPPGHNDTSPLGDNRPGDPAPTPSVAPPSKNGTPPATSGKGGTSSPQKGT